MPTTVHFFERDALCFARGHDSRRHAHRAVQLTLGLGGPFRVELDGVVRDVRFAHVPPQAPHRVVALDAPVAYLFVDPGPRAYAAWRASLVQSDVGAPPEPDAALERELAAVQRDPADTARAERVAKAWLDAGLPGLHAHAGDADPRIAAALAHVERDPLRPTNHRELAALAHLSVSRFAERFRAATGMPVRNWLLWQRLLRAARALQRGASVTDVAHATGFADAAHLSRSFRNVIGSAPSDLGRSDATL